MGYCYSDVENDTASKSFAGEKVFTKYHKKMCLCTFQIGHHVKWQGNDLN